MIEHFFQCPYCWLEISMLLDPSIPEQEYVEDCENCCQPIKITAKFRQNRLIAFHTDNLEQ